MKLLMIVSMVALIHFGWNIDKADSRKPRAVREAAKKADGAADEAKKKI